LGLLLVLAFVYAAFNLRLFPWTRAMGESIMGHVDQSLELTLSAIANYLPNLFIVAIISFIAFYALRVIKPFFTAVERGHLEVPGFYSDWARPTYNLLVILVLALAAILAFPYLPGFNSPAFQGVSVFLGLLLSLGSTSAITNVIGGIILIYTRAFRIGDHIRVGDVVGDIIETNFLAVRICTPANQVITIPNSTLLSNKVVNYNISSRELRRSLILQTTVSLGYNVPWRKVHDTLIEAALSTAHILKDPAPFILQTSLDNNSISYQLNAYTDEPNMMVFNYSLLHQSIQDKCNENGIEILSPNYTALRDGNPSTTPAESLPATDLAPPFRMETSPSPPPRH
jgi:small-conductance mechanosensitive channel